LRLYYLTGGASVGRIVGSWDRLLE
jgi:hypothetical protein